MPWNRTFQDRIPSTWSQRETSGEGTKLQLEGWRLSRLFDMAPLMSSGFSHLPHTSFVLCCSPDLTKTQRVAETRERLGFESGRSHAGGCQGHVAGGRWWRHARNDGRCAENCAGASRSEAHEGAPGHQHLRYAQAQSARQNAPALVQGEKELWVLSTRGFVAILFHRLLFGFVAWTLPCLSFCTSCNRQCVNCS